MMLASSSSVKWTQNQRAVASGLASHVWDSQDDRTLQSR
jgi:hypothetical protein